MAILTVGIDLAKNVFAGVLPVDSIQDALRVTARRLSCRFTAAGDAPVIRTKLRRIRSVFPKPQSAATR